MNIEKKFILNATQKDVWDFITSPELVATCIPGCEVAEETAPGKFKASIKTKVGPVNISFNVNIETREERPPDYAAYVTTGEEGNRASRIKANSTLSIRQLDAVKTEVTYHSKINLMGRLGKFGSGMMQKVVDSMGEEFVNTLRNKIENKEEHIEKIADNKQHPKLLSATFSL